MDILDRIVSKKKLKDKDLSYAKRINFLKSKNLESDHIDRGVKKCVENIDNNILSFIVYGEPQSGKTEFMVALCCRLFDKGIETIFIIANDSTDLSEQNFTRFQNAKQLGITPISEEEIAKDPSIISEGKNIIFCRKNSKHLRRVIEETRKLRKRVVLDDECDYATPDGQISKEKDPTIISGLVSDLVKKNDLKGDQGIYIGVTATPGRCDTNATMSNDATKWVFLDSHSNYVGRETFFPSDENFNYELKFLSDNHHDNSHLRDAVYRFILRNSYFNLLQDEDNQRNFTMLFHTNTKTLEHDADAKLVRKTINKLIIPEGSDIQESHKREYNRLEKIAKKIFSDEQLEKITIEDVCDFIFENISQSKMYVINGKADNKDNAKKVCENPPVRFTFGFGGNLISRGLTFNNLLSLYFTRDVKTKLQHNTYIQRARMFGNRKEYLEFFELTVPESLFYDWFNCFEDHERGLFFARSGNPHWFQTGRTRHADAASIDKDNIVQTIGTENPISGVFELNDELINILEDEKINVIHKLEKISAKINDIDLENNITFLKSQDIQPKSFATALNRKDGKMFCLKTYADYDDEQLTRAKGGVIAAQINGTKLEMVENIIMPVTDESRKRSRILYKSNKRKLSMRHLRNK